MREGESKEICSLPPPAGLRQKGRVAMRDSDKGWQGPEEGGGGVGKIQTATHTVQYCNVKQVWP